MPRRTHCFTYGETRTQTLTMNGATVTLGEYKSACGVWSEDASASPPNAAKPRPKGVCRACFTTWRKACSEIPCCSPDVATF